jgi:nucleotide-binding universal stress UspA family protein
MAKPYIIEHATRALRLAFERARTQAPSELHVVHASIMVSVDAGVGLPPLGLVTSPIMSDAEQQAALMEHLNASLASVSAVDSPGVQVYAHVLLDAPAFALTALASELNADLIVVGSHGRNGLVRWLLGSVAEAVVRQAGCPVLIVPPPPDQLPVPTIAPPCPVCLEARKASGGARLWCDQHAERHGRRHTYHQVDRVAADTNLPLVLPK